MALCSFSSGLVMEGYTVIDNTFFNEFLPMATGDDVKVYLYGLSLCTNPNIEDNSLDSISKVLSLTPDQVIKAFEFWQEMGLVQIISVDPVEVKFLKIKQHSGGNKIRSKEKYSDFNKQIQKVISGRMITPNEFNEYYYLIESYHFEPEAFIEIAHYCAKLKSTSIGYPYILAVARSFANDGIKTLDAVEKKLEEQELSKLEIKQVLDTLGLKREADIDERNMFLKWTNNFGFSLGIILEVARQQKKRGGFSKLDETLTKYFELKLFTLEEISRFSEKQETMLATAKMVCNNLGLYYQSYDNVIKTYISNWANMGYENDALELISNYCFKRGIRQLDGMNTTLLKLFKLGIISKDSIEQYTASVIENDNIIRSVLETAGLLRGVNLSDREFFKIWTESWGFSVDAIKCVAEHSKDKSNPMPYINKLLATLHENGKKEIQDIKKYLSNNKVSKPQNTSLEYATHGYSKEELNAVFDSLDDVEI